MRRWQITVGRVVILTAETQAEAVLQFEQDHPELAGSIARVEDVTEDPVRLAEARARRDE